MAGTDFFRTFKGLSELKLYNIANNITYNLPVPLDFSIDNGIQERRIATRNAYGEQVFSDSFTVARDPILRIVFPTLTPEVLQFKTEYQFEAQTGIKFTVVKTIDPTYYPVTSGSYTVDLSSFLSGVTINSVKASTTTNNKTTNVIITGTNTVSIPTSVSQNGENVTLTIECTDSVISLGQKLNTSFKLFGTVVTTENELVVITAFKAKPSFQGSNFSPSMEQIETVFYLQTPSGQTKPYDIIYTGVTVS